MRLQGKDVRDALVGTDDDPRAILSVDAAQVEDVRAVLEVRRVRLFVVAEFDAPLARQQHGRQFLDLDLTVGLLERRRKSITLSMSAPFEVKRRIGEFGDSAKKAASSRSCLPLASAKA